MRVFLDINVFLDFYLARGSQENIVAVKKLFGQIEKEKMSAMTSLHSLCTLHYVLCNLGVRKIDSVDFIQHIAQQVEIVGGDNQTVLNSLDQKFSDFEDGIQAQLAKENNCEYLITNNVKDFLHSPVVVYKPVEMIEVLM